MKIHFRPERIAVLVCLLFIFSCEKKSNLTEEVKEVGSDISRASSKAVRNVKEETCELVNGKMECVGQKVKHSLQNAGDKIEDAID